MSAAAYSDLEVNREELFEVLGYKPHSEIQWSVHRSGARFRITPCGRRFGKTTMFGHELTIKMLKPDSINWIVAPKFALGEKEFRIVWNDFKKLGLLGQCQKSYSVQQGNMSIRFKKLNSFLEVKSAEKPDGLVGEGLDHVCMSEAAKHRMSTWQQYIEPALSDKRGSADFPSTPEGHNWYEGLYEMGLLGNGKVDQYGNDSLQFADYASWRFPTWTNAVMFPGGFNNTCAHPGSTAHDPRDQILPCGCNAELARIKRQSSEMYWQQEYSATFTSFEGQIYPEFNENVHVKRFEYQPKLPNWWGMDFGYVDPFICLDIMIDTQQRVWVWREYAVSYKATHEHGTILQHRENPPGFHVDAIAADPRGADEIATLRYVFGARILDNAQGWQIGVEAIKQALKVRQDGLPGLIIHPRCVELIRQMKRLRAREIKEGHNEKQGQHDYDDHCCDALRYFFNEYVVNGGGASLSDLWKGHAMKPTEASTFFQLETGMGVHL